MPSLGLLPCPGHEGVLQGLGASGDSCCQNAGSRLATRSAPEVPAPAKSCTPGSAGDNPSCCIAGNKNGNGISTTSQHASARHPSGSSGLATLVQRHRPSIFVAGLDVVPAVPPAMVMVPFSPARTAAGHSPAAVPSTAAPAEARQERTSAFPGLPPSCRHVSPGKCLG